MIRYAVKIYGLIQYTTPVLLDRITVERWANRINAPDSFVFSLPAYSPKATDANLRKMRRVELFRDGVSVFNGFIAESRQIDDRIEVICSGMLQLFAKRFAAGNESFSTDNGSTEAFGLLSAVNLESDTGITAGTGGVSTTRALTMQGDVTALAAWEKLAAAHGAEFRIRNWLFDFMPSIGSDKSGTVHFKLYRDGRPGTNLSTVEVGESASDMANRVIGANATLTSTKNDATSQSTYGLLIERKQFNEAGDQTTLDAMTQAYLDQRANPLTDFRAVPLMAAKTFTNYANGTDATGLDYEDVEPGDLVTVTVVTERGSDTSVRRVAEVAVEVDADGRESVLLTLSKAGVHITAAYLDVTRVDRLTRDLNYVETLL